MNLLLLFDDDFLPDGTVALKGRRAAHVHRVLKTLPGGTLRVGRFQGPMGRGRVLAAGPDELRLSVELNQPPPPKVGLDLLLAIPRPKALRRVLAAVASMGVRRLVLVNAARVEKSYFDSHVLAPERLSGHLLEGLEQAQDTVPPEVVVRERFRPFVEDELPGALEGAQGLVAHPTAAPLRSLPFQGSTAPAMVAVGPEGGWVEFELKLLERQGFVPFSLGERTLRVEVAVPYVLGQLLAARSAASAAPP